MKNRKQVPILELKGITKRVNKKNLVNNLSFTLKKGDIYGFLGPNGSGKTTTLRMITQLIFPTTGEILINGYSVEKDRRKALSAVGSIIENPAFYLELTAKQNLSLSNSLADKPVKKSRIDEVLDIVRLSEAKGDKVKTFSLGMKQRLGLANALLCNPDLIILDEPTNGVDPVGLREMKVLIKELAERENITFLISSHMLREMQDLCNRVTIIQTGKLLESGAVDELLKSYQVNNLEDLFFACVGGKPNEKN
ncbi:hypothetical protein A5819_003091 [Enterococcus sp. 7E2_DIV0204]|uniref:ABC transporter ATP-binding protein n=1 Tax=unclassified Enterococcus TaxID=2608891 RepID=UPI000A33220C|nr:MULTISPECIES: ABC transporter ATP-binding protein [unclassified Enterococcus]OTN90591.1 hypothetical protein A5819_003091 [Enterococcus sp. 7E2_DIV0204]OTP53047.1 hypothetical protein A5884_002250 [Enterococcus sp. 7D2_DIV0200]